MDWYIVKRSKYTAGWFRGEEEGEFFGIEKSAKVVSHEMSVVEREAKL